MDFSIVRTPRYPAFDFVRRVALSTSQASLVLDRGSIGLLQRVARLAAPGKVAAAAGAARLDEDSATYFESLEFSPLRLNLSVPYGGLGFVTLQFQDAPIRLSELRLSHVLSRDTLAFEFFSQHV